jgi:hypothetical protein
MLQTDVGCSKKTDVGRCKNYIAGAIKLQHTLYIYCAWISAVKICPCAKDQPPSKVSPARSRGTISLAATASGAVHVGRRRPSPSLASRLLWMVLFVSFTSWRGRPSGGPQRASQEQTSTVGAGTGMGEHDRGRDGRPSGRRRRASRGTATGAGELLCQFGTRSLFLKFV